MFEFTVGTSYEECLRQVADAINRIEARQRATHQHDPECRYASHVRLSGRVDVIRPCNCWLKEDQ